MDIETEKEIQDLTDALAKETSAEKFVERSKLYFSTQLYQKSLDDAKSALQLEPKLVAALVAGGKASLKLESFLESFEFYKEGLALDPKNTEIAEDLRKLQSLLIADYERDNQLSEEHSYNAVELCSQDVYPGDDELMKLEVEILAKKYKIDATKCIKPVQLDLKTKKDAATIAVMAFNAHEGGRLQEALECIQVAIRKDETNTKIIQIRAEIFRDLGEDVKALADVISIPKPYRVADVWKLGGKILAKLELPVMAEFWFRKATALIPEKEKRKDLEAPTLFQKVRVKRLYGPLTLDYPVTVDFTDYGRAVYATEKLDAGEDAFNDFPVVLGQLFTCLELPGCDHCGRSLITHRDYFGENWKTLPKHLRAFVAKFWPEVTPLYCRSCRREKYCSASCQQEAWTRYHQIICPSVNAASNELYDIIEKKGQAINERGVLQDVWAGHYSPMVLMKIWGSIIADAKQRMKEAGLPAPTKDIWALAKAPFRKFISFGRDSAVKRMPEMFSLAQRLFADCGDGVKYPISEQEFEARYFQATCNLQAFSAAVTPKHEFMEMLPNIQDICSLQILKFLNKKPPVVAFAGMFPLHACLNHSCNNNVEVMDGFADGKPAVHVRVVRDINPGEELFTTYIDTSMPRRLRRAWLYKSFNFWCKCKRCQFEGDDNTTCSQCKKVAPEGKKFPGCGKCKQAWYCSTKCQKQAWVKGHKDICSLHSKGVSD